LDGGGFLGFRRVADGGHVVDFQAEALSGGLSLVLSSFSADEPADLEPGETLSDA
jgi:hypothetical protein